VEAWVLLLQTFFLVPAIVTYARRVYVDTHDVYASKDFLNVETLLAVAPTVLMLLDPQGSWHTHVRIAPWYVVSVVGAGLWLSCVLMWQGFSISPRDYVRMDFVLVSSLACNFCTSTYKCHNTNVLMVPVFWLLSSALAVLMHGLAGAAAALVFVDLTQSVERFLVVCISLVMGMFILFAIVMQLEALYCPHRIHNYVMLGVLGFSFLCLCCVGRWRQVRARLAAKFAARDA
jgi:hypothetical protein